MALPLVFKTAATYVTKAAQSETGREIAKSVATATAETLTQKAMQRLDGSRPAARSADASGADVKMAPRQRLPPGPAHAAGSPDGAGVSASGNPVAGSAPGAVPHDASADAGTRGRADAMWRAMRI